MIHQKVFRHELPVPIQKAWEFFSDPGNLQKITPEHMNFIIRSGAEQKRTYAGQIIVYTVSPLMNIPMTWVTEITHANEPAFFVDEQRKGPYKLWHHQHHFRDLGNGKTEMTDILHYEVPMGILGDWMNSLFISSKIDQIFRYREEKLNVLFGH